MSRTWRPPQWPPPRRGSSSAGRASPGVAAAYHLAVEHGRDNVIIVEAGQSPLAHVGQVDRGLPQLVARPRSGHDRLHEPQHRPHRGDRARNRQSHQLNRRGYLFATADAGKIALAARDGDDGRGARRGPGAGFTRRRRAPTRRRRSAASTCRSLAPTSSPIASLIRRHFPYLAPRDRGGRARAPRRLAERPAARHGRCWRRPASAERSS